MNHISILIDVHTKSGLGFGRTVDKTRFKPDKTGQNYFIVSVNT